MEVRVPVRLSQVPDHLVQAVLAVEDQRFYRHWGFDLRRIAGALIANLRAGRIAQGGSTITQQLAKNLFLSANRSPVRKLREVALAAALEARHDKAAILEAYLNEVYLGQDGARPIHGVGAASRYYFGRDVRRISLPESALLAGMISAPNRYSPLRNPELARPRRDLVLRAMADQGRIRSATGERARRAGLPSRVHPAQSIDARWFRDYALAALPRRIPARGVAVYTSLDARMQVAAERAVRNGLTRLRAPGLEGAIVALDPRTGEVLALVGGRSYGVSQFNRATEALRQPGSAFKPVVALAALARWEGRDPAFTLASIVDDEPLRVPAGGEIWQPANYDGEFRGPVTIRQALEQSLNVPFARIGLTVGPSRIVATARQLGITSPLRAVPSLSLGSSEVSLLELTRAYGVLAAGGRLFPTRALVGRGQLGRDPELEMAPGPVEAANPAAAYLVTSALQGVVDRGTGWALSRSWRHGDIAGKTGTSNQWRDAWFIAYTPTLAVGAWVGYDDGRSLGMTGATAALPIVSAFLGDIANRLDGDSFETPPGITEAYADTGEDWPWGCGEREFFLEGTEPAGRPCFRFRFPSLDVEGEWDDLREELGARAGRALGELIARLGERRRSR